jgi:hypothetical protein
VTTLEALVASLDNHGDEGTIYARRPWSLMSDAVVAEEGSDAAAAACAAGLEYLLEVAIARDAITTWTAWRNGQTPTPAEACEAVLYYATHDAYLSP